MFKPNTYTSKISVRSQKLLHQLVSEQAQLHAILRTSPDPDDFKLELRKWISQSLKARPDAWAFYQGEKGGQLALASLSWQDIAAIRILDYLDHAGEVYPDQNQGGKEIINDPFLFLYQAFHDGTGGTKDDFFEDMLNLFRQYDGRLAKVAPDKQQLQSWMDHHPSGLDPIIVRDREKNRERILGKIIDYIDQGKLQSKRFFFEKDLSRATKLEMARHWWSDYRFHLRFAIRSPGRLNDFLDNTIEEDVFSHLMEAREKGIPTFVNPYYLSLLNTKGSGAIAGSDLAIRDYIFVSRQLVEEFGQIVAWEKEDQVEPGKPNAAGWILPLARNLHRRYPEVAILIPDTMGRACGGLCVSCQRMYDFQRGNLNFNLDNLAPDEKWPLRLKKLMSYFENDSQLRDILITGGDALMSSDKSLQLILQAIYEMAIRKKEANQKRADGEKYAEITRIRLGTRLPVYLPQRITPELAEILAGFRQKALLIGIKQFVIQTHFETAMEITPEVQQAISRILQAGWIVTNQQVFTAAASRRGHTAKLRKVLNDIGVLTYYTFSVKGYMENFHNFATNARAVQEQMEEKVMGSIPAAFLNEIRDFPENAGNMIEYINQLREKANLPFLSTDKNVLNLPGVGKSLSFRVIGITRHGRRILKFDHDHTRWHSPIIDEMGKITLIESKTMAQYMRQLEEMGEDPSEYRSLYGYSIGETEERIPVFDYPPYSYRCSDEMTHLDIEAAIQSG